MDSKQIIIRVKSQQGYSRINVSGEEQYQSLKQKIAQSLKLNYNDLVLLLDNQSGNKIIALDNTQIKMIKQITNGVQLWAKGTVIQQQLQQQVKKEDQTKKIDDDVQQKAFKQDCKHGPNGKCLNCTIGFKEDKNIQMKWQCTHGPNGKCSHCVDTQYAFLNKKKMNCKHQADAKCNNCIPPGQLSFKKKEVCGSHTGFKQAMCSKCLPDSCNIKRQEYRHVDYVEFMNYSDIKGFLSNWVSNNYMLQRIGMLYGYYSEDPNYKDGVRAIIEAVYEPPQIADHHGSTLLNDQDIYNVELLAENLGLERIGWIFTDINHDSFMDSHQVRQAAQYQHQFSYQHPCGYPVSKFISVVFKTGKNNQHEVAPEVYMVSDQCQALERDNVFEDNIENKTKLVKRKAKDNDDLLPSIIYDGKNTNEIDTDFFLVNIAHGQPINNDFSIIKHGDFPKENRGILQTNNDLKKYLQLHRSEKSYKKYSDFHLLLYISKILDIDSACVIAQSVYNETEVSQDLQEIIKSIAGL